MNTGYEGILQFRGKWREIIRKEYSCMRSSI